MTLPMGAWALALVLAGNAAVPDSPAERLAVLVLPDPGTPAVLADNLTEVALSRLAERRRGPVVGTAELRRRLSGIAGDRRANECVEDIACLGRVGVALGVRRVISGTVRQEDRQYMLNLVLTDIQTAKVEARFFRLVPGGLDALVAAIQEGTDELFVVRPAPGRLRIESVPAGARVNVDGTYLGTTPMLSGSLDPGPHVVRVERDGHFPWTTNVRLLAATDLEIKLLPEQMPRRRTWPGVAVTSSLVGAAASVGLGALLGTLSQVSTSGNTRQSVETDLDRRQTFATYSNVAFGVGVGLAAGAWLIHALYKRDIADE